MKKVFILGLFLAGAASAFAQQQTIDGIAGVVGNKIILQSEVDAQYNEYLRQQNAPNEKLKCNIVDQLMIQKLLLNQAELDSLVVEPSKIEQSIDQRIQYFTQQVGSIEKLEKELLGKSVLQFKEDIRPQIREQLLARQMQETVMETADVTPSDIQQFFDRIPVDSLPLYGTELSLGQLVKYPAFSKEQKELARAKLDAIRTRIRSGEDFGTLALLYSQDPGSANQSGELGFFSRGQMVGPFEAVAFKLQPGEVSPIVETKFGYHIIQSISRRGEQVNARHILIKPEYGAKEVEKARGQLDSAITAINDKRLNFAEAAHLFSDDTDTKSNGGMIRNPQGPDNMIPQDLLGQIDRTLPAIVATMKPGTLSEISAYTNEREGKNGFRVVFLQAQVEPHRASLQTDYPRIQEAALEEKKQAVFEKWVTKKRKEIYSRITPQYADCDDLKGWISTTTQAQNK